MACRASRRLAALTRRPRPATARAAPSSSRASAGALEASLHTARIAPRMTNQVSSRPMGRDENAAQLVSWALRRARKDRSGSGSGSWTSMASASLRASGREEWETWAGRRSPW